LQRAFIPVSRYVKLLKSIKIFQGYDHKLMYCHVFMKHDV